MPPRPTSSKSVQLVTHAYEPLPFDFADLESTLAPRISFLHLTCASLDGQETGNAPNLRLAESAGACLTTGSPIGGARPDICPWKLFKEMLRMCKQDSNCGPEAALSVFCDLPNSPTIFDVVRLNVDMTTHCNESKKSSSSSQRQWRRSDGAVQQQRDIRSPAGGSPGHPFRLLRSLPEATANDSPLWTSSRIEPQILRFYSDGGGGGCPRVTVNGKILRHGYHQLIEVSTPTTDGDALRVFGKTYLDAEIGAEHLVISLEKLVEKASADGQDSMLSCPVRFRTENGVAGIDDEGVHVLDARMRLRAASAKRDPISVDRYWAMVSARCTYGQHVKSDGTLFFDFCLDVLAVSTAFEVTPLAEPLPSVIPTALARGLADPVGNVFLHCQPKSGYVTVDDMKRLLFILDSDPKVVSLPLIGVWTSGVQSVRHPFVWAACVRYAHTVGSLSTPFLLVVYDRVTFQPRFYECVSVFQQESSTPDAAFHSFVGRSSGIVSVLDDLEDVYTARLVQLRKKLNGDHVTTVKPDGNEAVVTPRQRLSFAATIGSSVSQIALPKETRSNNKGGCGNPTTIRSCTIDSPIPPEVMRFLAAQEQQLNDLRQRVDDLTRVTKSDRAADQTPSVGVLTWPRTSCNAESPAAIISKTVSSTATMTSFAFPPLDNNVRDRHAGDVPCDPSDKEQQCDGESSIQLPRERHYQSTCSSTFSSSMSFENSLADLKLESVLSEPHSAVDCCGRPPWQSISPLLVDLPDFNAGSLLSNHPHESISFEDLSSLDYRNPDSNFYGNLLKRIQTILLRQSLDDGLDLRKSTDNIRRSVFDSLFLPRLNYVSLHLDDGDRSAKFAVLARKYLGDSPAEDGEISLDTKRYLRKYRLFH